jgi:hypothetical protein
MTHCVEVQNIQLIAVYPNDNRGRVGPTAAMGGKKNLLRGPVHQQIIDDDLIWPRAKQCRQFPIDALNQIASMESHGRGNMRGWSASARERSPSCWRSKMRIGPIRPLLISCAESQSAERLRPCSF